MPSGHNNPGINERRPLTEGMVFCLRWLAKSPVNVRELSNARKNQMRGLMDRGYATPNNEGPTTTWRITEAGKKAVL